MGTGTAFGLDGGVFPPWMIFPARPRVPVGAPEDFAGQLAEWQRLRELPPLPPPLAPGSFTTAPLERSVSEGSGGGVAAGLAGLLGGAASAGLSVPGALTLLNSLGATGPALQELPGLGGPVQRAAGKVADFLFPRAQAVPNLPPLDLTDPFVALNLESGLPSVDLSFLGGGGVDPAIAAGADFGGAVGGGIDPAIAAGADFGGGVAAPSTGLPSLGTALQVGGGLIGTGLGALDLSQGRIGPGIGKIAGAASLFAPPPFNIIGAIGLPLIGSLFGGGKKPSREPQEIARGQGATNADIQRVMEAETPLALAEAVRGATHQAFGGPAGRGTNPSTAGFAIGVGSEDAFRFGPTNSGQITAGTLETFAKALLLNPASFNPRIQLGVNAGALAQINQAFQQAVQSQAELVQLAQAGHPEALAILAQRKRARTEAEQATPPPPPPPPQAAQAPLIPSWPTTSEGGRVPWSHLLHTDESGQPIYGAALYQLGRELEGQATGSA